MIKGYTHFRKPPYLFIVQYNLINTRNLQVMLLSTVFMKYHAAL